MQVGHAGRAVAGQITRSSYLLPSKMQHSERLFVLWRHTCTTALTALEASYGSPVCMPLLAVCEASSQWLPRGAPEHPLTGTRNQRSSSESCLGRRVAAGTDDAGSLTSKKVQSTSGPFQRCACRLLTYGPGTLGKGAKDVQALRATGSSESDDCAKRYARRDRGLPQVCLECP